MLMILNIISQLIIMMKLLYKIKCLLLIKCRIYIYHDVMLVLVIICVIERYECEI